MQLALFGGMVAALFVGMLVMRRMTVRGTPEETRRARLALSHWIAANRIGIALAFGGGGIALTGAAMFVHALFGETREVELASLEAGRDPGSSFVRVSGLALGARAICSRGRSGQTCYTPLVAEERATRVAVLLADDAPIDGRREVAGFAWYDVPLDLPGRFRDDSGLEIEGALVLMPGETPEERRPIGLTITAAGAVLAAIGAFLLRRKRAGR